MTSVAYILDLLVLVGVLDVKTINQFVNCNKVLRKKFKKYLYMYGFIPISIALNLSNEEKDIVRCLKINSLIETEEQNPFPHVHSIKIIMNQKIFDKINLKVFKNLSQLVLIKGKQEIFELKKEIRECFNIKVENLHIYSIERL